jgi:ABC-2 type transport system permease protein
VTVWRLETLRLFRTLRWAGLLVAYLVFGVAMPIVTRYQDVLFRNLGGDVRVIVPPATPPQGIAAYLQNAMQVGLLVSVLLAAASLAFDAKPEWAAFLRTRSPSAAGLVVPKLAVNAAATVVAFAVGLVAAWSLTSILIGSLPVAALVAGALYGGLYLTFAVSVVAAAAGVARSVIGAAGLTLVVLILLPALGEIPAFEPWVPSALVGSPTDIAQGVAAGHFLRAAAVSALATAGLAAASGWLLARREI